jgi:hypothetical protein
MTPGQPQPPAGPEDKGAGGPPAPAPMPMMPPPPPPSWVEVAEFIKQDRLRGPRVDVETDSTLAPDPEAEQNAAVNFVAMLAQYLQAAIPAAAAGQIPSDVVGKILLFVVRRFPVARDLESTLEAWVEKLSAGQAQIAMPPDPMVGIEKDKVGLEKDRMAQEGQQKDADRAFQASESDKQFQAQKDMQQAMVKGPPFLMGDQGAPMAANELVQGLQAEFENEMMQVTQALMAFMQQQAQMMQQMQQTQLMIIEALQKPRKKTILLEKDARGQPVAGHSIEEPIVGPQRPGNGGM